MSITQYRTLIAIADHGSFSAAADIVCVSHAAVGQQMRRLEDQLRVTLFDRTGRSPKLSPLGWALVPRAREIVRDYDTILDGIAGNGAFIGEFRLGAVSSTMRRLIPRTVRQLLGRYPELRIHVTSGLSNELQTLVTQGTIDAAVLSEPESLKPELEWHPFVEEKLVLVTSPDIVDDDPVNILETQPFVRHARAGAVGVLADKWLAQNRVKARYAMEMESLEDLISMVAHNLGVSIVPNLCVPDRMFRGLRKIDLGDKPASRALCVLTREDSPRKHLIDAFVSEIERTVRTNPASHENQTKTNAQDK